MTNYLGQQFGDYRLIYFLGKGTYGDVYEGEHIYLGTHAAVKLLKGIFTPAQIGIFRTEARILAQLEHPHIVRIITFSVCTLNGQDIPFLVMSLAPHGTLLKLHPRGRPLPLTTIVTYVNQIALALQHAHDNGYIHRDVKPENILLGKHGELLLSDCGIAVVAHSTESLKTQDAMSGTIPYMAPEQIQGKPRPASDQYALGIITYEWLCGTLPFTGSSIEIATQHLFTPPPSLCDQFPELSSDIEEVVFKALAKDTHQLWPNVQDFAHAFEAIIRQQSVLFSFPGVITLTHLVGKRFVPVIGQSQLLYVLLMIKPTALMSQARMPLNFSLVLDCSSSMKGAKLKNVKEAVKMVIDRLEPTDYISVVIFDDTSQVIIPSMPVNDRSGMKAAIDRISVRNPDSWDYRLMSKGMLNGLNELRRYSMPQAINRMILLTDGVTYGDSERCRQLAREAAAAGISIYPLGIGVDWDEDLLDNIGQLSGGMPTEFIRDPADALSIFQQQIQSAVGPIICNATLIVRLAVGVSPKKAVKVLPIISDLGQSIFSDRHIIIPLGDVEQDSPQSVLLELMIDPRPAGLFRIAQAELTYDIPIIGLVNESLRDDFKVTFTTNPNQAAAVNATVMNFAEKANALGLVTHALNEYKRTGKATTRLAPNVTCLLDEYEYFDS